MEKLTEGEIDILVKIVATFEHPESPELPAEFRKLVTETTTLSNAAAEYLFEHLLSIDPDTRYAMHFHHRDFVVQTLAEFNKARSKLK